MVVKCILYMFPVAIIKAFTHVVMIYNLEEFLHKKDVKFANLFF